MNLLEKFRALFRREKLDADMAEEMRGHLERRVEANRAEGMSAEEARYAARRQFGGVEQLKEIAREERGWLWLDQMVQDLRYAARQLGKTPGFTVVAVLSLGLGIGANTAVFSVAKAVLLQALPVRAPEQLVLFSWLSEKNVAPPKANGWEVPVPGTNKITHTSFSISTFEAFQSQPAGLLSDVVAFAPTGELNVKIDGAAEILPVGQFASDNYHRWLGVTAAAGRLFQPGDNASTREFVAVISHRYWQRRFGGDASAIGKAIAINGTPVVIVGVTAPGFNGTLQVGEVADITLPLTLEDPLSHRRVGQNILPDYWWVRIMGRLKPGATAEQVRARLETVFHDTARGNVGSSALAGAPAFAADKIPLPQLRVEAGGRGLYEARKGFERSLRLLMAITGLVLLVACANVANLQLARGASRRREIAVRLALGASRTRVVRQLLAESIVLAAFGAGLGLLFSLWGTPALLALRPFGGEELQLDTTINATVLGFTSAVALATAVMFGLAPALRSTRLDLTSEFQGGARTLGSSRSGLAKSLMVAQVALSLVLLVTAGLFVRTLRNLQNVDLGFTREQLLLFQIDATASGASTPQALALYERLQERLASLPGVRGAGFSRLSQDTWNFFLAVPGYPAGPRDLVRMNGVSPDYFTTLEFPLLAGRNFTPLDAGRAPKVAIVNQSFAKKYFGTEAIIGRRFTNSAQGAETEIIGLIRDAPYSGAKSPPIPIAFCPFSQLLPGIARVANFAVKFTGNAGAVASSVRTAARALDPGVPLTNLRTQAQHIERQFATERLFASLCSVFSALALLLVAIGLYGLMSYAVLCRTGEIGVRMALGALPQTVSRMILRESLGLVVIGVAIGLAAAYGTSRFITSMLFGLGASDPATYGTGVLLLLAVAVVAAWLPARRAARVDPMVALRAE